MSQGPSPQLCKDCKIGAEPFQQTQLDNFNESHRWKDCNLRRRGQYQSHTKTESSWHHVSNKKTLAHI